MAGEEDLGKKHQSTEARMSALAFEKDRKRQSPDRHQHLKGQAEQEPVKTKQNSRIRVRLFLCLQDLKSLTKCLFV